MHDNLIEHCTHLDTCHTEPTTNVVDTRVSLTIRVDGGGLLDAWSNFINASNDRAQHLWHNTQYSGGDYILHRDAITDQDMEKFNASTDWADSFDPIWFSDAESRAVFILTWS